MLSLRYWSIFASGLVISVLAAAGHADTPAAPGEKWYIDRTLTLSPIAPADPVLQYKLLPLDSELKPGNAVPIYLRLVHEQSDATRKRWTETPKPWNALPVDRLPLNEAREFLAGHSYLLEQLEWGARSQFVDWNYTIRPGHVIDLRLPDMQNMRSYVPMMVLQARTSLAEGNLAAAARSIETGFAFSRHLNEAPFLICGLVGIACARQFGDCVGDFIERPNAPNLYWSLTALPRPLIDLRHAFDFEYRLAELEFPDLVDLDRPRSPAEWDAALKQLRTKLKLLGQLPSEGTPGAQKELQPPGTRPDDPAMKAPDLPEAKKYLAEHAGLSAEALTKMPASQILLAAIARSHRDWRDQYFKLVHLPYHEASRLLQAVETRLRTAPETELNLLPRLLLPALSKVLAAQARLDRQMAALRAIEAIRAFAARHGQLPDSLAQVTGLPTPLDPGTSQPFEYRRDGGQATLISRIPGEAPEKAGIRYTIAVRQ